MRAIITGAAGGIGKAVAQMLQADAKRSGGDAARLVLVDYNKTALDEVAATLLEAGAEIVALPVDLSDPRMALQIVTAAQDAFGGLDALVSNAGIFHRKPLLDLSVEHYDAAFAINTRPTFLLGKAAHPLLKQSSGSIVATTSIAAYEPAVQLGAYSPSKAALLMLVRQMACDWGRDGIRINAVSPGTTRTGIGKAGGIAPAPGAQVANNPLGFNAEPEDQAAAIVFLLGPQARFINGADIVVDGGARTQLMQLRTD